MTGDDLRDMDRAGEPPVLDPHLSVGAYAVDALEGAERRAFEQHLSTCEDCRDELDSLREAAGILGGGTTVTPPPQMRADVLARIRDVVQEPAGSPEPAPVPEPIATPATPLATVTPLRRKRVPAIVAGVAAAVLAVVAIGVGIRSLDVQRQLDDSRAMAAEVTKLLTAPDLEVLHRPTEVGGEATLVSSAERDAAVFLTSGLPAAPEGHTYQLWTLEAGQAPTSAGVFKVGSGGSAAMEVAHSGGVAVTVEPAGGSDQPTTEPVVALTAA